MAYLVKCDVDGCGSTEHVDGAMSRLPVGWRMVMWTERVDPPEETPMPDEQVTVPAHMVGYLRAVGKIAQRLRPQRPETYEVPRQGAICPKHDLPKIVVDMG